MTDKTFFDNFMPNVESFLKKALPDLQQDLLHAASQIVRDNASKVKVWVVKSSTGELSSEELKWLIASQLDLSRLNVLKEADGTKDMLNGPWKFLMDLTLSLKQALETLK